MTYRDDVERLLGQIRDRVHELQVLRTRGLRPAALEERKQELARVRQELASVVLNH